MSQVVVCVDFGSTFTKAVAVDLEHGRLLAGAAHRTTIDSDVMDGFDAVRAELERALPGADLDEVRACSSAGGGLRLAVVGYERVVTAEAGARVGLSAGARVVHVSSGAMADGDVRLLAQSAPDVVLLVGGTDGGNADVLLANAKALSRARLPVPVVVAGNVDVSEEVARILRRGQGAVHVTSNVLPRIGVLDPRPAREAIRDVFIRHVIGGKHLSRRADLSTFVRAATPDTVLAGVELLADGWQDAAGTVAGCGDVVLVDVGGATTDVYSVVTPDDETQAHREVVETMWRSRTVEGDLGVRWNALGIVEAAAGERLLDAEEAERLLDFARRRVADPGLLPESAAEAEADVRLATLAVTTALRRHARATEEGGVRQPGKDLRRVRLVVGSGGVFRHGSARAVQTMLTPAVTDRAGGWRLPEAPRTTVDTDYVLAAAGLLADDHPLAAARLLETSLLQRLAPG
ncbi:MAG: glutamate mutase L [Actinomycetes bacterium]